MKTTYSKLTVLILCLFLSISAHAIFYPETGFSSDFHVYTNSILGPGEYSGLMAIKFWNNTGVKLNSFSAPEPMPPPEPIFITDIPEFQLDVDQINFILASHSIMFSERAFTRPELELDLEREKAEIIVEEELPDLNLWFFLDAPDYPIALELLVPLFTNPVCEIVYLHPNPTNLPTANLEGHQTYLQPAVSNGYDALYAWTQPGGDGSNVKLIDIEYDWYYAHEDLLKSSSDILWGVNQNLFGTSLDHGTASLGVSGALSNSYGMKGIVYNANIKMISSLNASATWLLHDAISYAVSNTSPGDVILLEQQASAGGTFCPVEYWALFYSPIANAAALNRIIIEPAGNGFSDLDVLATWGNLFQRSYRDSGAIMVGAGTAANRSKVNFSDYGSRVDIQGWGDWSVASLGYGDLTGTVLSNEYTKSFSGTSSASALSAGVAASVESYAKTRYGFYLPSLVLRSNLVNNGIAQTFGPAGNIGPLPNLGNSFTAIVPEPVVLWIAGLLVMRNIMKIRRRA